MDKNPFSRLFGSSRFFTPAIRSPRAVGFSLIALGFAILLFLIGLRAWSQPFSGSFDTEILEFKVERQIDLPSIASRDISVSFRGSVDGPVRYSSDEDRIKLRLTDQLIGAQTDNGKPVGINTAKRIVIPASATVKLSASRFHEHVDMTISKPPETLELVTTIGSSVSIESGYCEIEECPGIVETPDVSLISIMPIADEEIVLRFSGQTGQQTLAEFAPITEINTWLDTNTGMGWVKSSGLLDGTVQFANSSGSSRTFYSGEVVDLTATDMIMRGLQVENGVITVQLSGELDAASTSIGSEQVSIMPSWFDVLANDARVRYALGFISLLIGLGQLIGWNRIVPQKDEN